MQFNWFLPSGSQGSLRRWLRVLGPTWGASPLRRGIQTVSFLVFGWLFLYVCWPYTAEPKPPAPPAVWDNWQPLDVDAETGVAVVVVDDPPENPPAPEVIVTVVDHGAPESRDRGQFRVVVADGSELTLKPVRMDNPDRFDEMSMSFGPWSLSEIKAPEWPSHHADELAARERLSADVFLALDPLVSISAALASRTWLWSLSFAGVMLAVAILIPRCFCGYLCPLGTLIDLFDWSLGRRVTRFRISGAGWCVHLKYYVLVAVLVSASLGVVLTGFVAAIPVLTRAAQFLLAPLQIGLLRQWHQVPPIHAGQFVSIGLFLAVLFLGLMRPRFWCRYVCPTGAMFSVASLLRLTQRKVDATCIQCGKCAESCPFDAVTADFETRTVDCASCQTCGGVCAPGAIRFVSRWSRVDRGEKGAGEGAMGGLSALAKAPEDKGGRRSFLAVTIGGAAAAVGGLAATATVRVFGARLDQPGVLLPVRPPGSVPEALFLQRCIRCGQCFKVCPNNVLQPLGFEQGLEGLWTPEVVADWSGCEPSCNNCGQVCPTEAIRALPLEEKRAARMALAVVNERTCLPHADKADCRLCFDDCADAGYHAIEFETRHTKRDTKGKRIEGSGYDAPKVIADRCVGCGICQMRCYKINVVKEGLLQASAVRIEAGHDKEDRYVDQSYVQLREEEAKRKEAARKKRVGDDAETGDYWSESLEKKLKEGEGQ
ncbi:MAG: 4Fe-4S binding protein [Planctomycetes bacterium]|nr:4Fe-4S binding protein [Planctomycetota bacterium]